MTYRWFNNPCCVQDERRKLRRWMLSMRPPMGFFLHRMAALWYPQLSQCLLHNLQSSIDCFRHVLLPSLLRIRRIRSCNSRRRHCDSNCSLRGVGVAAVVSKRHSSDFEESPEATGQSKVSKAKAEQQKGQELTGSWSLSSAFDNGWICRTGGGSGTSFDVGRICQYRRSEADTRHTGRTIWGDCSRDSNKNIRDGKSFQAYGW